MKKLQFDSKLNLTTIVSIFFLAILGCQPEGGELLPLGGGNVEIAASRFENDTAVINDDNLKIKLYGDWNGRAKMRTIIENNSPNDIKINLNQSAVTDSKGENLVIDSFAEVKNNVVKEIKDKEYTVAPGEKYKFLIGFPLELTSALNEKPSRIISVVLAIESNSKAKELRKYKFDFKGIESKDLAGKPEPEF